MRKLFSFSIAVLCSLSLFAQTNRAEIEADMLFFNDPSCTSLKKGVRNTKKFKSETLRSVAQQLLNESYATDYIVADYEAYPSPQVLGQTLKLGDGFSKYENITGVYLNKGENIVFVGNTHGRSIKLLLPNLMRQPADGVKPTEDPNGWGLHKQEIELMEGANIIDAQYATNAYISYFEEDFDVAPKITVHFLTGKVNGYFDTNRGDTNNDWNQLLENAVGPIMDARGKFIQVAYPVEWFKTYTQNKGIELIAAYDTMMESQYRLMGLIKYNKTPKNRVFSRVNFNYYMFRDGDGVAYLGDRGTMRMVADPKVVVSGDPCWGFSHEVGHVLQMRPITWGGLTEVSNNIFSLYTSAALGNESRIKRQNNYAKARETIIGKGISYLHDEDVFNRLVPFWQLHLYFTANGHPDFYADVMEQMRKSNFTVNSRNESINYQFEFMKICSEVSQTDLTEFFEQWGFFWVGEISLSDYGNYTYNITQEMVDETKQHIASKGYQKPTSDITLTTE